MSIICIGMDPTNPGQFFACCGVMELADRLWGGAEAWFERDKSTFCIRPLHVYDSGKSVDTAQREFANSLADCPFANTMTDSQLRRRMFLASMSKKTIEEDSSLKSEKKLLDSLWRESPIVLAAPFNLQIDWFADDHAGGSIFKTWAGQQSVIDIAHAMRRLSIDEERESFSLEKWLSKCSCSDDLPFNFDSDLGNVGGDRDVGFSFDPLKNINVHIGVQIRPTIELLAFIGLQRFRPVRVALENRFRYWLWSDRLTPEVASAAACGLLEAPTWPVFEFRLFYRTKYLKSFLPAIPVPRSAL